MRIISGKYKGRRFSAPKNLPVRPTTDMAKEALFNILNNRISWEETEVLDLFAGIGGISLEFASRECPLVWSVDINVRCLKFIRETAESLGVDKLRTIRGPVQKMISKIDRSFDLIFADPPYDLPWLDEIPDILFETDRLKKDGLFILEHGEKNRFSKHVYYKEERNYGSVNFSFFQWPEQ